MGNNILLLFSSLVEKTCEINSTFFIFYLVIMLIVIGLFLAVSFTLDMSLYLVVFLLYPTNLYLIMAILCALGQSLTDSVSNIRLFNIYFIS